MIVIAIPSSSTQLRRQSADERPAADRDDIYDSRRRRGNVPGDRAGGDGMQRFCSQVGPNAV